MSSLGQDKSTRFTQENNEALENSKSERLIKHKKLIHDVIHDNHKKRKYKTKGLNSNPQRKDIYNFSESISYLEPDTVDSNTVAAKKVSKGYTKRSQLPLFFCAVFIGAIVALFIHLAEETFEMIQEYRSEVTKKVLSDGANIFVVWSLWVGSGLMLALTAVILVLWQPSAASSGIPGLIQYLNGCIPTAGVNIFGNVAFYDSFYLLVAKYIGTLFATPSGLAIGPEGPIIHISAIIGKFCCAFVQSFEQYMTKKDFVISPAELRDFLAIGAAAGVSTAFHAPLAGVFFVVEEASSCITVTFMELIFCGTLVAYWVSIFLDGITQGAVMFPTPTGPTCGKYDHYDILVFIAMAVIGGWLGAGFNAIVEYCTKFRIHYVNKKGVFRVLEVIFLVILTGTFAVFLPLDFECRVASRDLLFRDSLGCLNTKYKKYISSGEINSNIAWDMIEGHKIIKYLKDGKEEWKDPAKTVKCINDNSVRNKSAVDNLWKNSSKKGEKANGTGGTELKISNDTCKDLLKTFRKSARAKPLSKKHEKYQRVVRLEIALGLINAMSIGCNTKQLNKALSKDDPIVSAKRGNRYIAGKQKSGGNIVSAKEKKDKASLSFISLASGVAKAVDKEKYDGYKVNPGILFCEEGYLHADTQLMIPNREGFFKKGEKQEHYRHDIFELENSHAFYCEEESNEFNEMAMLWLNGGKVGLKSLLHRGVPHLFTVETLMIFFVCYFFMAGLTAGTSVPAGLVVPMLLIGASFGRACGILIASFKEGFCVSNGLKYTDLPDTNGDSFFWSLIVRYKVHDCGVLDPGSYAIIGCAAFMGGSGRITMFLAVVLLELTNDISLFPPMGLVTIIAMLVGNIFNDGLYHSLMHLLSIPYLQGEPSIITKIIPTSWVMATPVMTCKLRMTKNELETLLSNNDHNGFPVCDKKMNLIGFLERKAIRSAIQYARITFKDDKTPKVDMANFMDLSPISVNTHTKVFRVHTIFVSLGLRHLSVVDRNHKVVGMITRKDLIEHHVTEAAKRHKMEIYSKENYFTKHKNDLGEARNLKSKYPDPDQTEVDHAFWQHIPGGGMGGHHTRNFISMKKRDKNSDDDDDDDDESVEDGLLDIEEPLLAQHRTF